MPKAKNVDMTNNSPPSRQISKSYQILILALICGLVLITTFFVFLCITGNNEIVARHLAKIEYIGDAIKNAIEVANNVMYAYESRYDDRLRYILHDFNEKLVQVGDPDHLDLDALKQEYEAIYSFEVTLYILDNTNTIIASTDEAEIGVHFSEAMEFGKELTQIYTDKKEVLDITTRNQQSGEMLKYGYIASDEHDYLLKVGLAISDLFIPDHRRYVDLDPNIITTPHNVLLFSKQAVLRQDPEQGLLPLGSGEQTVPYLPERLDYLSKAFSERGFKVSIPEENKHIDYFFISYPSLDAPSRSYADQVLEVTVDLTPLHEEIYRNTLIIFILTIICGAVFIGMILLLIKLVVRPINQIVDDIEIIANGAYNHKIKQTNGPEFDRLEASITKMIAAFYEQHLTLLQKNSSLHALIEASTHGVITVGSDMCIHHFNTIFCEMWGLSEDIVYVGANASELLRHCANQTINPELFMSTSSSVLGSAEIHIHLLDGRIFQSIPSSIHLPDGTYYGRIWEVIDITDRIQREQELERAYANIKAKNLELEAVNQELTVTEEELRNQNSLLKATESELIRQNSILSTLQEHLAGGFYVFDENKKIISYNQKFLDLFGFSREELEQNPDGDYFMRCFALYRDTDEQRLLLEESTSDRTISSHDEVILVDGTILERYSTPIIDKNSVYYGRLREFIDITERVQREQDLIDYKKELEEKNSLLSSLLGTSDRGIMAVDDDRRVLMFNQAWFDMWNLSEDIMYVGSNAEEIVRFCMSQTNNFELHMENFFKIHDSYDLIWNSQLYLSNGKIFNAFSSPIQGLDGAFYGRVWKMQDVTEESLKQQELERAYVEILRKENQLTLALEGAGEGLWIWNVSTEEFTLNPEFAARYYSLSQVQSLDLLVSAIHPDERELCLNIFHEITKKDSNATIVFELQLQSNEGPWRWILSRGIVSEVDNSGVPLIITGTFVDITERRQYEKHLREANRKILMLSQITRHDIVNQLNNLFAISDVLSNEVSNVSADMLSIKDLLKQMDHGLATVKRQIEFSRDYQELGCHGAEWQDVHVCIENIRPLLIHPPVELVTDNLPIIFADPLLEKAMYNLIENSIRHGEGVTIMKVTFSVEDDDYGILIFEDNGVGIPTEDKEKIFDQAFGKNTGLGLFLIREIFGLTEMTIRECGEPGHGARFEIMIPIGYWKWQ